MDGSRLLSRQAYILECISVKGKQKEDLGSPPISKVLFATSSQLYDPDTPPVLDCEKNTCSLTSPLESKLNAM
jgi:hypothetical protein